MIEKHPNHPKLEHFQYEQPDSKSWSARVDRTQFIVQRDFVGNGASPLAARKDWIRQYEAFMKNPPPAISKNMKIMSRKNIEECSLHLPAEILRDCFLAVLANDTSCLVKYIGLGHAKELNALTKNW